MEGDVSLPLEDEDGYVQCKYCHFLFACERACGQRTEAALGMEGDVSLPLEDEDGYVQCKYCDDGAGDGISYANKSLPAVLIVEPRRRREESECWSMASRKRSKSLERLSAVAIRPAPSRGPVCSSVDLARRRRNQQQQPEVVARPPRVPPRPNEQLLNRFQQQRAGISLPPAVAGPPAPHQSTPGRAVARRKYVAIDLGDEKGGGGKAPATNSRGSPRLPKSRPGRTSYAVLQINEADGCPPSSQRVVRRERPGGGRAPVKRCKSSATERSLNASCDPRHSAALPSPQLHFEDRLRPSPSPQRKPRKVSTPKPLPSHNDGMKPHLPVQAVSIDDPGSSPVPPNDHSGLSESASLHVIDLRIGTTGYRDKPPQVHRPPPPLRKPPCRPPAPIPRPRKNLPGKPLPIKTNEATDLEPYVQMSPADSPASDSNHIPNGGGKNATPLPRESWGQPGRGGGAGKERAPTPDSGSEEFGAYSYVDLVKNRHLLVCSDHQAGQAGAPIKTSGADAEPLSVYTPLSFSSGADGGEGLVDEGGGVYTSPEVTDHPLSSPPPEAGDTNEEDPVPTNPGDIEREGGQEPLYMVPGDQVYYDDKTYAPLTAMTKLEESMYAVRMTSPTPLSSSCS